MIFKWIERRRARIAAANAAAEQSERHRERVESQWPEVRERVAFSREQREMNHLTELFLSHRGGRA